MPFNPIPSLLGPSPASGAVPVVSASATAFATVTTASTNAGVISAAAVSVYELTVSNTSASAAYIKFYDRASSPTVGTDVPVLTIPVPAYATFVEAFGAGKRFGTGLALAATGGIAATDTANAPAGVQISLSYV